MTNNKQQTVLEWYIEMLLDLDYEYAKGLITLGVYTERKNSLKQQAQEMHKEEIIKAFDEGQEYEYQYHINSTPKFDSETYYNETYGGEQ
jgi:hypothetical protein